MAVRADDPDIQAAELVGFCDCLSDTMDRDIAAARQEIKDKEAQIKGWEATRKVAQAIATQFRIV